MFEIVVSPLIYLVAVIIPLLVTLETLNIVCFTSSSNNVNDKSNPASSKAPTISTASTNLHTLVFLLKYWSLYGIIFGVIPPNVTNGILANLPFASLIFLVASGIITQELLTKFTKFIQSQDGKFIFLFNKFNDTNVSWYQWFSYATTYDENNIANLFIFGEFTQFWISLSNKFPFPTTNYLERSFDSLLTYLSELTRVVLHYLYPSDGQPQSRATASTSSYKRNSSDPNRSSFSTLNEGYDLLDDLIEESKKRQV